MAVMEDTLVKAPARNGRIGRARRDVVGRTLALARELLDMDVTYIGRFEEGRETFPWHAGDTESFGLADASVPLSQSYCSRVVRGTIPTVVPDTSAQPELAALPITDAADIGAYVGVPLRFSDGRVYGTLCAASHESQPELAQRDLAFMHVLAELIADHLERDELEGEKRRAEAQASGVAGLLAALEARDSYTGEHSDAVVKLAAQVARELSLSEREIADVEQVALLHDIGKVGIPDSILRKPAPLDDGEWALMRQHPAIGARIVGAIPSLAHLAPAIRSEHERWDGSGYPDGLAGEQIPLASRICLACDAFHAMVSDRPYRRALPREHALAELERGAGSQFCPDTVAALLAVLETLPAESAGSQGAVRPFAVTTEGLPGDGGLIAVEGELDMITCPRLDVALGSSVEHCDWVVIDLSATSYLDSSALRVIVNAARAFEQAGVRLAVVPPDGPAWQTFEMTGLSQVLDTYRSREEAFGHCAAA
jgi:anti-anti-sigma factor